MPTINSDKVPLLLAFTSLSLVHYIHLRSHSLTLTASFDRDKRTAYWGGAIRSIDDPGWFPFGKIYAQDMLLVVLCATYSCISPLILVAGMIYFAFAAYFYTHQMLFVYEPIFETGGKWWPKVAQLYIVALLFAQSTMAGMMILKQAYYQAYLLFFLIMVTAGYFVRVHRIFVPVANQLPFDMATSLDLDLERHPDDDETFGSDCFMQPAMRVPKVEVPSERLADHNADGDDV